MYDLLDRCVTELPDTERHLLGAMRAWVHALTLASSPIAAVATRFADGGDGFDEAMRRLDSASLGTLTFHRPCHDMVEDIEAVVLGMWRQVIAGRIGDAHATAALLVNPDSAAALVGAMRRVVRAGDLIR